MICVQVAGNLHDNGGNPSYRDTNTIILKQIYSIIVLLISKHIEM